MNKRLHLKITAHLSSPLHVGGGKGSVGAYSYLQRDQNGNPYWPGSAFKGKARHFAMQLYGSNDGANCVFSHNTTEDNHECNCPVCDMLGSAGNAPGRLIFSDMHIKLSEDIPYDTSFRTGNAIDRYLHVARDQHLFGVEVTHGDMPLVLEGFIDGYLDDTRYDSQEKLLRESIKLIACIGGNTSRGLGWLDGELLVEECVPQKKQAIVPDSNRLELVVTPTPNSDPLELVLTPTSDPLELVSTPDGDSLKCVLTPNSDRLKLIMTPKSLALFGTHSTQSNFRDTLTYIPGHVFRAGLANAIIARCGSKDKDTERIRQVPPPADDEKAPEFPLLRKKFNELRFTCMTPLGAHPFPLTACTCKYADCESCQCIYWDTLAKQLFIDDVGNETNTDKNIDVNAPFLCAREGKRAERAKGWFYIDRENLYTVSPRTMVVTKSAIDRYRGTARDEMLYSMRLLTGDAEIKSSEIINGKRNIKTFITSHTSHASHISHTSVPNENNTELDEFHFCGYIEGDIDRSELEELFSEEMFFGARQTSGYGCMVIDLKDAEPQDTTADIRRRIERFNALIPENKNFYIPITLLSDAQVDLPVLSPAGVENDAYLDAYFSLFKLLLPTGGTTIRMIKAIARVAPWRGFDTSQKEKFLKNISHRIHAGSVFVLRTDKLSDELLEELLSMQYSGICSRDAPEHLSQNGFGQVRVADEFHIDYAYENNTISRKIKE